MHNLYLFFRFNAQNALTQKPPPSCSTVTVRSHKTIKPLLPSQMPPVPLPYLLLDSKMPNDLSSPLKKKKKAKGTKHRKTCLEKHQLLAQKCEFRDIFIFRISFIYSYSRKLTVLQYQREKSMLVTIQNFLLGPLYFWSYHT